MPRARECHVCHAEFSSGATLSSHVRQTHQDSYNVQYLEPETGDYVRTTLTRNRACQLKCPLCLFKTRHLSSLQRHLNTQHPVTESTTHDDSETASQTSSDYMDTELATRIQESSFIRQLNTLQMTGNSSALYNNIKLCRFGICSR